MKTSALGALALLLLPGLTAAASFTPLGDPAGGTRQSRAYGVSSDGSAVVGQRDCVRDSECGAIDYVGFLWTSDGGMVGLGDPGGGRSPGSALGVSADASVVVGHGSTGWGAKPFRWTSGSGMVGFGDSPLISANGVSADGSVVVGRGKTASGAEAVLWTSDGGMLGLGEYVGGGFASEAYAVSADGSVLVGAGSSALGKEAFRWTSDGGVVGLGDLAGGLFRSEARGVSADGSVVVGYGSTSALDREAFRWTSDGGMVGLGNLGGGTAASEAYGVSADGSVVVGTSTSGDAFVWTVAGGMQRLFDLLVANGAAGLTGWRLIEARAISPDGQWVVGFGRYLTGNDQAFVANIGTVPAPATFLLLATAFAGLGGRGWLRRKSTTRL